MPSAPCTLEQAVEAIYHLNAGMIGTGAERHERPHKPLLLLAVLDLIAEGRAMPDRIPWSQGCIARMMCGTHRPSAKGTPLLSPGQRPGIKREPSTFKSQSPERTTLDTTR